MPHRELIAKGAFGPETVHLMVLAYTQACERLGLVERDDALNLTLARHIIEATQQGFADPEEISVQAISMLSADGTRTKDKHSAA